MFENIYEAEIAIGNLLKSDNNCSAHFHYSSQREPGPKHLSLDLITYNPKHKTHFLLHSISNCKDRFHAINEMYDYVYKLKNTIKKNEHGLVSYTIEWYNTKEKKSVVSYFNGENLLEIISKFYYGKPITTCILKIKLNPSS